MEPVDVVLSDLPVGYYPDDDNAQGFQLKAEEGHSFAHHLFIEQSLTYTKPGGYLFFLVPNFLFEMDKDKVKSISRRRSLYQWRIGIADFFIQRRKARKEYLDLAKERE